MAHPSYSEELATLYRAMTEEQLLALAFAYDTLTDAAQAALRTEFASRKLEPPEIPDTLVGLPDPAGTPPVVVGRYRDLPQAQLARCALESAGIPCFLRDENTIRIEWQWSNLMGGIRLQVAASDREAAEAILSQPFVEDLFLEDEVDSQLT